MGAYPPGFPAVFPSSGGGTDIGVLTRGVIDPNGSVPANAGDHYYRTDTGELYTNVSVISPGTTWVLDTSGSYHTGAVDPNGAVSGVVGDTYYRTDTGEVYTSLGGTVWLGNAHSLGTYDYRVGPNQDYTTVALALAAGVAQAPEGTTIRFLIEYVSHDDGFVVTPALTLPNTHYFVFDAIAAPNVPPGGGGEHYAHPKITFVDDITLTEYNEWYDWFDPAYNLGQVRTVTFRRLDVVISSGKSITAKWGRGVSGEDASLDRFTINLTTDGMVLPVGVTGNYGGLPTLTFNSCVSNSSMTVNTLNPGNLHAGPPMFLISFRDSKILRFKLVEDLTPANLTKVTFCSYGSVFDGNDGDMFETGDDSQFNMYNSTIFMQYAGAVFSNPVALQGRIGNSVIIQDRAVAWSVGLTDFTEFEGFFTIERYATFPIDAVFPVGTVIQDADTHVNKQWDGTAWQQLGPAKTTNIVYADKSGSDATGDGSAEKPYLTIQEAIDNASAGDGVYVNPGTYTENLTVPADVLVYAANASLTGYATIADGAGLHVHEHTYAGGLDPAVAKASGTGTGYYNAFDLVLTGAANGVQCPGGSGHLVANVKNATVGTGVAFGQGSISVGVTPNLHLNVERVYITESTGVGVAAHSPLLIDGRVSVIEGGVAGPAPAWVAPVATIGATTVTDGTELQSALAAIADGGTIEMTVAGEYAVGNGVTTLVGKSITINAMVEGCYITGGTIYSIWPGAGKTVTWRGVEFRNGAYQTGPRQGTLYQGDGNVILERCRFAPTGTLRIYVLNAVGDSTVVDSCVFVNTATSTCMNLFATSVVVRNTIVDESGTAAKGIRTTGVVYNCAVRTASASCYDLTTGDYNISTDTSAPGANSIHNVVWGSYYDANFTPLNTAAQTGGDSTNLADYDYDGNLMVSFLPPIGAFVAVGSGKNGIGIQTEGTGVVDLYNNKIECGIAYNNEGRLRLNTQDISGTRTDGADNAKVNVTGLDQSHVETLTPSTDVEINVDTMNSKSLAIAHDVAFTLAGAAADLRKSVVVYIANGSGSDRAMTFPAAWEWTSFEPNGIADGEEALLTIMTIGTVVTASYALLDVAPDAPTVTSIAVADSPYTPSPQEVIHVDASGGDVTIQLPASATFPQAFAFIVDKEDSSINSVIVDADTGPSETINGAASMSFNTQYESWTVMPNPTTNWRLA